MSIHPSLSASAKAKKVRSVLKRAERLKILMDKDSWKEGQSIFALPKIKTMRIKIKKEKAAPAAAEATAEAEVAPSEKTEATSAKASKEEAASAKTKKGDAASAKEKPSKPSSR